MKKNIIKKLALFLSLTLFLLPVLTSCSNSQTQSQPESSENIDETEKKELNKIKIILDWTPNTNHTGLFVAKDKGYFEEAGVEVEIMQPPEGSVEQLVATNGGEFGISFQDFLAKNFANDNPMPVTAVAAILQHNTSGIVSLKEAGIETAKDLSGKRYSTWNDPTELAMLDYVVNKDGADPSTITKVPYSENLMAQLADPSQNGSDSAWIYYAWDGIAFEIAGVETNFIPFTDYAKELDYYTPVLIANNKYLEENSKEAKAVIKAISKGYEYAIENPEEAAQILLANAPELDQELATKSQEWISSQYVADAEKFGVIDQNRWDAFFKWLYENNLIEKEIPAGFGFTNEYLQ